MTELSVSLIQFCKCNCIDETITWYRVSGNHHSSGDVISASLCMKCYLQWKDTKYSRRFLHNCQLCYW